MCSGTAGTRPGSALTLPTGFTIAWAMLSILDIFRIGIGPSSSHTVGPMRIARRFVRALEKAGELPQVKRMAVELQGSLALTGIGHGTVDATILGLAGFRPERTDPDEAARTLTRNSSPRSSASSPLCGQSGCSRFREDAKSCGFCNESNP